MKSKEITKFKKELLIEENKLIFYEDNREWLYLLLGDKLRITNSMRIASELATTWRLHPTDKDSMTEIVYNSGMDPVHWRLDRRQTDRLIQFTNYRISWIKEYIYKLENLNEHTD